MADEKSTVNMNKMIQKETGASFLVVHVIYVSLLYTDSKKTTSCLPPDISSLQWQIGLYLSLSNLMYNIRKLYFNDQQNF